MSMRIPVDRAHWEFDGVAAALKLLGTDAEAPRFDPAQNGNDFTVAGFISPDTIAAGARGIFGKWVTSGDKRSWLIQQFGDDLEFFISQTGAAGTLSTVSVPNCLSEGAKSFFCARYKHVGAGTSEMKLRVDGTENTLGTAVGPVYSSTSADLLIGRVDSSFFSGKKFWLAYWNRRLTDDEAAGLDNGTILPQQLKPDGYIDFHRAVAATYEMDLPWYTGIDLTVEGSPEKGEEYLYSDHYNFDGVGDALRLLGTDANALIFDPQSQNDDFTIFVRFTPDSITTYQGLLSKWNNAGGNYRSYALIVTDAGGIRFYLSKDGISGSQSITIPSCLAVGQETVVVARYTYNGDGDPATRMDLAVWRAPTWSENSDSLTSASGPVFSTTSADVQIGDYDAAVDRYLDADKEILAFFNRRLSDYETNAVRRGWVDPRDVPDCDYLTTFHRRVGTTMRSDVPADGSIEFTVEGNPTHSSPAGVSTVDVVKGRILPFDRGERINGDLLDSWHTFDGLGDYWKILGSDPQADDFDGRHTLGFTVFGFADVVDLSTTYGNGLITKYNTAGNHRCWGIFQEDSNLYAAISKNGAYNEGVDSSKLGFPGSLVAATPFFCALTYRYIGAGVGRMRFYMGFVGAATLNKLENLSAVGDVHLDTSADVAIGYHHGAATDHEWDGKIYATGYIARELADLDIRRLWRQTVMPWTLSDHEATMYFRKAATATYVEEWGGHTWTRNGAPTPGGTGGEINIITGKTHFPISTVRQETANMKVHPRATAQEKGRILIPDPSIWIPGLCQETANMKVHPRATAQEKGRILIQRKKRSL